MLVTKPSMNKGNINSVDTPVAYARTASTQQELVTHSAIDKDSGSLFISALSGRLGNGTVLGHRDRAR
jgi:hypothetical protein